MPPNPPGTFTVKPRRDGGYLLTGTRPDGSRHRMKVASLTEGHTLGQSMFQGVQHRPAAVGSVTSPAQRPGPVDDFGVPADFALPQVSPETVAAGAPGAAPPVPPPPTPEQLAARAVDDARQAERKRQAKTVAEMIGLGVTAGEIFVVRKALEARYEDVPKANPKQMNEMANAIRDGIAESFGNREVGPWTMALMLAIGIPVGMWLQSSKPRPKIEEPTKVGPGLTSVP